MSSGWHQVTMAYPAMLANPYEVRRGSLRPAALMVVVADAGVVAVAWSVAVGAPLGRGMVLFGTNWAGVCY